MSVQRPATQFFHHRLAHGHGAAGLVQFERESPAISLRQPNGQAAVNGDLGVNSGSFVQTESAHHFGRDSQGETVAPFGYLKIHDHLRAPLFYWHLGAKRQ